MSGFGYLFAALAGLPDARICVAVSGGGDSVALLVLLDEAGFALEAVTIDHALRPASAAEAQSVAKLCKARGIAHKTLRWQHKEITGNLQDAAREARQKLISQFMHERGLTHVVLGHTRDDQAETLLLRLARGSGVDGLAGMARWRKAQGINWHRPLLGQSRADLRAFLRHRGIDWAEDPSNQDLRFDRVKMRKALALLAPLGIDAARLQQTADHMRRSRIALDEMTSQMAKSISRVSPTGDVSIDLAGLLDAPLEIRYRLVAAALCWVGSARYRPRFSALQALLDGMGADRPVAQTLHGCNIYDPGTHKAGPGKTVIISREFAKVSHPVPIGPSWDSRWAIAGPFTAGLCLRALGEDGLQQCPNWRDTGHTFRALLAVPSVWRHAELIAAPLANVQNGWETALAGGGKGFYDTINALKADQ